MVRHDRHQYQVSDVPLVTSRIAYALHCFPVYNCHICHAGSSPAVIAATPGILTVMLMCSLAPCFPVTSDCWSWKLCHGMCSLVADACLCLWYNSQLFIVMGIAPLPSGIRSHLLSLINSPDNSLQSGCRVSGSPCEMQLLFFLPAGDIMNVRLAAATAVSLLLLALLPIYAYLSMHTYLCILCILHGENHLSQCTYYVILTMLLCVTQFYSAFSFVSGSSHMLKYNLVSSDDLLVYLNCFLTVVFYARLHSGDQIPQIEDSCFITPPFFLPGKAPGSYYIVY